MKLGPIFSRFSPAPSAVVFSTHGEIRNHRTPMEQGAAARVEPIVRTRTANEIVFNQRALQSAGTHALWF